jgi:hypothetical protein
MVGRQESVADIDENPGKMNSMKCSMSLAWSRGGGSADGAGLNRRTGNR